MKTTITVDHDAEEPVVLVQAYGDGSGHGRAFGPFRNDVEANAALDGIRAVSDSHGWNWVVVPLVSVNSPETRRG